MVYQLKRRYPEDTRQIRPEQTLDSGTPPIRVVPARASFKWLQLGWRDLRRAPAALLHGLFVSVAGVLLVWATWSYPWLSMALIVGFLLIGPSLAANLNAMAQGLERAEAAKPPGGSPGIAQIGGPLSKFTAVLFGLFILWTGYTWLWIAVMNVGHLGLPAHVGELLSAMLASPAGIVSLAGVLIIWLAFAFLAFAMSVITVPAMLGHRLGVVDAVAVSLKAFRGNPVALTLWAALITALFVISVLTAFIALIVIFPWLGFAMWHGYRDLVATT